MEEIGKINEAIDELLVNLGGIVMRLSVPEVTQTPGEREALARSVATFAGCAATSSDARVQRIAMELEATQKLREAPVLRKGSRPDLRLIICRP